MARPHCCQGQVQLLPSRSKGRRPSGSRFGHIKLKVPAFVKAELPPLPTPSRVRPLATTTIDVKVPTDTKGKMFAGAEAKMTGETEEPATRFSWSPPNPHQSPKSAQVTKSSSPKNSKSSSPKVTKSPDHQSPPKLPPYGCLLYELPSSCPRAFRWLSTRGPRSESPQKVINIGNIQISDRACHLLSVCLCSNERSPKPCIVNPATPVAPVFHVDLVKIYTPPLPAQTQPLPAHCHPLRGGMFSDY